MTSFNHAKPIRRVTGGRLSHRHGLDSDKQLVVQLRKGDLVAIKPYRTRRWQVFSVFDIYSWMLRTSAQAASRQKRLNYEQP